MSSLVDSPTYEERRSPQQKLYDAAVLERVKAGIALLEEQFGPSWVDYIDMKTLDLSDGAACVLGQVYAARAEEEGWRNGFSYATHSGDLEPLDALNSHRYGFCTEGGEEDAEREWDALQQAWNDVLTPMVVKS